MTPYGRMFALLVAGVTGALPVATPASADTTPTTFGVIASTQGSEPDTMANWIRLYDRQRARYDEAPIGIRLFSPNRLPLPGDGSMAGKLLTWAADKHPEETITVSHKNRDDARLKQFLDWVQKKRLRVSVIYYHEVQDDITDPRAEPATYLAAYRGYRKVIAAHPARARVTLEKNLMWWWQHYRATPAKGDWRQYVEKDDPADVLSWDTYVFPGMPTAQGRYATPDEFFRYARDAWREYDLDWGIGEIGTTVQDGGPKSERAWDPDGRKFAAWVSQIVKAAADPKSIGPAYKGMPPARFLKWWGALDSTDHRLDLDQSPAAVDIYQTRF
ncbi:MAG: hypothetical protein ABW046_00545 [Actinoplanes sp.]